jgi:hypothetical protein
MDTTRTIQTKLSAGRLPNTAPLKTWAGKGTGLSCDGCDETIPMDALEYEWDFENGWTLRLHVGCAAIMQVERARRPPLPGA